MGIDNSGILHTWIDSSYAVHDNVRRQSGGEISMSHGVVKEKSVKKKLNSKSSTETEIVGIDNILFQVL